MVYPPFSGNAPAIPCPKAGAASRAPTQVNRPVLDLPRVLVRKMDGSPSLDPNRAGSLHPDLHSGNFQAVVTFAATILTPSSTPILTPIRGTGAFRTRNRVAKVSRFLKLNQAGIPAQVGAGTLPRIMAPIMVTIVLTLAIGLMRDRILIRVPINRDPSRVTVLVREALQGTAPGTVHGPAANTRTSPGMSLALPGMPPLHQPMIPRLPSAPSCST